MLNYQHETPTAPAYDDDFVLWLDAQVEFLRAGRYELLDKDNLLEELTAMNRHERRGVCSRLEVVIIHLLKCQYQAALKTRSWRISINEQRRKLHYALEMSPSLRRVAPKSLEQVYSRARREAVRQTGLPAAAFPDACPYSLEQLLDDDFLP
jgi:hypothetical protein